MCFYLCAIDHCAFGNGIITEWLSPMPPCISDDLMDVVYLISVFKLADAVGMAYAVQVRVN